MKGDPRTKVYDLRFSDGTRKKAQGSSRNAVAARYRSQLLPGTVMAMGWHGKWQFWIKQEGELRAINFRPIELEQVF